MFVFGHTGIGRTLAAPFARGLPDAWFMVGALLPDLVDKTLYYVMSAATGLHGADLGLISGTRTWGHTGILLLAFTGLAAFQKSRAWAALALGMGTHLLLDAFMDLRVGDDPWLNGVVVAVFFPGAGIRFPVSPFPDALAHAQGLLRREIILTEGIGLLLLGWHFWKSRHQNAVVRDARAFAQAIRKRIRWRRRAKLN
jgi:hypothetical protein